MRNCPWKSLSSPWKIVIWGLLEPSVWGLNQVTSLRHSRNNYGSLAFFRRSFGWRIERRNEGERGEGNERTFSRLSPPRFSIFQVFRAPFFCVAPHLTEHLEEANGSSNLLSVCPSQYSLTAEDGVDLLERTDVHIHFPAGAVGKDGPSAGVTIVTVLVSLFRYIYLLQSVGRLY